MTFLTRIQLLLDERQVSKNKFLSEIGANKSSLFDWERRGTTPGGDTLCKIADYFGVSVDYLLGRTDAKALASDTPDPILAVILERYEALNPEGREKLADLADDLAASGKYIKNNAPGLGASQI